MIFLKYFITFLLFSISLALYGGYYTSNVLDLKADVKISSGYIADEQKVLSKYLEDETIEEDEEKVENFEGLDNSETKTETENSETENNGDDLALEKTDTENDIKTEEDENSLKIINASFYSNNKIKKEDNIAISFKEEINLYSLLGFKEVKDGEFLCDGEKIKSEKEYERCEIENKIFITKYGEEDSVFKGTVKKSEIDKKTIIISAELEELQDYDFKILAGVISAKSEDGNFKELKSEFSTYFLTTDSEGNFKKIRPEESEETEVNSDAVVENEENNSENQEVKTEENKESEEIEKGTKSESENNDSEADEETNSNSKTMNEWLKKKQEEFGEQNTDGLKKAINEDKTETEENESKEDLNTENGENTESKKTKENAIDGELQTGENMEGAQNSESQM